MTVQGPLISARIEQITLRRNDFITVWLDSSNTPGERNAAQIELRVLADGTQEIFTAKDNGVRLIDFHDWYTPEIRHIQELEAENATLREQVKKGRGSQHREGSQPLAADCEQGDGLVESPCSPEPKGCAMPGCCAAVEELTKLRATAEVVERARARMEQHGNLLWYDRTSYKWVTNRVIDPPMHVNAGTAHRSFLQALQALAAESRDGDGSA